MRDYFIFCWLGLNGFRQLDGRLELPMKLVSLGWDIFPTQQNHLWIEFLKLVTGDWLILMNRWCQLRGPTWFLPLPSPSYALSSVWSLIISAKMINVLLWLLPMLSLLLLKFGLGLLLGPLISYLLVLGPALTSNSPPLKEHITNA